MYGQHLQVYNSSEMGIWYRRLTYVHQALKWLPILLNNLAGTEHKLIAPCLTADDLAIFCMVLCWVLYLHNSYLPIADPVVVIKMISRANLLAQS